MRSKSFKLAVSLMTAYSLAVAPVMATAPSIWPITADTLFVPSGDSFNVEQFANRYSAYKDSGYILMNPDYFIWCADISRSGDDDLGGLTNRECAEGYVLAWTLQGNTNIVEQLYCSGNHIQPPYNTTGSNYTYTNMVTRLQWPYMVMNRFATLTQAWTFATNKIIKVVYSDAGYYQPATLDSLSGTFLHCLGGSNAAFAANWQYIDSYHLNLPSITNGYPGNSNLWFNAPNLDHPGTVIQMGRAMPELVAEGMDTNAFTVILDAGALSVSSSNHCTFTNFARAGNVWSGYLRPGRLSMAYDAGDAGHTNDARGAFTNNPALTNLFHEDLVMSNVLNGLHVSALNGVPVATNLVTDGILHLNFFHITKGPIWDQKMQVLDGDRISRDVSPLDASTYTGQTNISYFASNVGSFWPSSSDMNVYAANVQPYIQNMFHQAQTNHMNAQPRTFLFTDTVTQTGITRARMRVVR